MNIHESGEMYLETILILRDQLEKVRAIDIAENMNFSKPSVSRALGILKNEGYIEIADSGAITLTDKGYNVASKIYERHQVLSKGFIALGVSEQTAIDDACRIEHVISDETFDAIKKHFSVFKK